MASRLGRSRRAFAVILMALSLARHRVGRSADMVPAFLMRNALAAGASEVAADFVQRRQELKSCLEREYTSFFRPFEEQFYTEGVTFRDPLNDLAGKASYKANVEMLSGESLVGNLLFCDAFIDLHSVEDVPGEPTRLRTRWTLGFAFKLLPWKPNAVFSGVSEYVIDPSTAMVVSQRDFWDILSLGAGGSYAPEPSFAGVADLVGQLMPAPLRPVEAQEPVAAMDTDWKLLRRARAYRVYRTADNLVFALPAPGFQAGLKGVESELKAHGLKTSDRVEVKDDVLAVEVRSPHPWDVKLSV